MDDLLAKLTEQDALDAAGCALVNADAQTPYDGLDDWRPAVLARAVIAAAVEAASRREAGLPPLVGPSRAVTER